MKTLFSVAAAAALTLSLTFAAEAHPKPVKVGNLEIELPWTRATPGAAKAGGGFLKITNTGDEADHLVKAASPRAGRTEIHEMAVKDGIMIMRQVKDPLEIPAGGSLELKPGGYHVMFMKLPKPFKEGETIPVTLTFEKAGSVEVGMTVEKPGAKDPVHAKSIGHDHGDMKHDHEAGADAESMEHMDHGSHDMKQ